METYCHFVTTDEEIADMLFELAEAHHLSFYGTPSAWMDVPAAQAIVGRDELLAWTKPYGRQRDLYVLGPFSFHPLAFSQAKPGGQFSVDRARSGPLCEPRRNGATNTLGLNCRYAFDPQDRDAPLPPRPRPNGRYLDLYPPSPELDAAFDSIIASIRARLTRHEHTGGAVWASAATLADPRQYQSHLCSNFPDIIRGQRIKQPRKHIPAASPMKIAGADVLRRLELSVGRVEAKALMGEVWQPLDVDDAALADAIGRLDGEMHLVIVLCVFAEESCREFFVQGGVGNFVTATARRDGAARAERAPSEGAR
jgi:hypothetical protein